MECDLSLQGVKKEMKSLIQVGLAAALAVTGASSVAFAQG